MRTIHKYPLSITDEQFVAMPQGFEILSVTCQRNTLVMWAIVDPDQPPNPPVRIVIVGTGGPTPERGPFIGTVQMPNGGVWHVFRGRP